MKPIAACAVLVAMLAVSLTWTGHALTGADCPSDGVDPYADDMEAMEDEIEDGLDCWKPDSPLRVPKETPAPEAPAETPTPKPKRCVAGLDARVKKAGAQTRGADIAEKCSPQRLGKPGAFSTQHEGTPGHTPGSPDGGAGAAGGGSNRDGPGGAPQQSDGDSAGGEGGSAEGGGSAGGGSQSKGPPLAPVFEPQTPDPSAFKEREPEHRATTGGDTGDKPEQQTKGGREGGGDGTRGHGSDKPTRKPAAPLQYSLDSAPSPFGYPIPNRPSREKRPNAPFRPRKPDHIGHGGPSVGSRRNPPPRGCPYPDLGDGDTSDEEAAKKASAKDVPDDTPPPATPPAFPPFGEPEDPDKEDPVKAYAKMAAESPIEIIKGVVKMILKLPKSLELLAYKNQKKGAIIAMTYCLDIVHKGYQCYVVNRCANPTVARVACLYPPGRQLVVPLKEYQFKPLMGTLAELIPYPTCFMCVSPISLVSHIAEIGIRFTKMPSPV